jgi:hypothetical protein
MRGAIPPLTQYAFMAWCLVKRKHRDNFTFTSYRYAIFAYHLLYTKVSKSFRSGGLEQELQMVQLSASMCSYIAILWVSLGSFAAITLCVASQRVFIVVVIYFVMTQSGNFWIHPRMIFFYCTRTFLLKQIVQKWAFWICQYKATEFKNVPILFDSDLFHFIHWLCLGRNMS